MRLSCGGAAAEVFAETESSAQNNRLRLSVAGYRPVAEKYENSITSCLISFGITSLLVWGVPCGHPSGALIHIFTTMRASNRAS
jgi:hypothetical protein